MTNKTCCAERLASFLFWLPRYWEHRIAPPADKADRQCLNDKNIDGVHQGNGRNCGRADIADHHGIGGPLIKEESSCSTIIGISSFRKSKLLYKCCVLSCINEILFSYFQIYFSTIFFNGKGSIRLMIALPGVRCGVSYNFAT